MRTVQDQGFIFSTLTAHVHFALFLKFVEMRAQIFNWLAQMAFIESKTGYFDQDSIHSIVDHFVEQLRLITMPKIGDRSQSVPFTS